MVTSKQHHLFYFIVKPSPNQQPFDTFAKGSDIRVSYLMHAPSPDYHFPPEKARPRYRWALHRYACFCAGAVLFLICIGGLVTSHEAGMSVPDWPNTYGYNMFLFPIGQWVGGVFYEHTHRLLASAVGLLTVVLAVWLWRRDPRRWDSPIRRAAGCRQISLW